jgi:hypothetical protein
VEENVVKGVVSTAGAAPGGLQRDRFPPAQKAQRARITPQTTLNMAQLCKDQAAIRYNTQTQLVDVNHFEQFQASYELSGVPARMSVSSVPLTRTASFCIFRCAESTPPGVNFVRFPKQRRFVLYISQPAGILTPSFKSTRIQHEIICKSLIPGPSRA